MILDAENLFCKDFAVTATCDAPNVIDLGMGDAGPSGRLNLFVRASELFTGSGAITVELATSDAVNDNGELVDPVTVARFPVDNAKLAAGGEPLAACGLPHGMKRYAGLAFTVDGTLADGRVTAGLVWDI